MAANKRKILEAARKLAQKSAKDKALAEYQKLLKLDPKDAKLRLEIGDAHRRWGQVDQAIETYSRVAEQYMAEGFDARAVAVFKQILNLDPDRFDAYAPLAELYERMGLAAEAITALQTAADGYHRQGRRSEALGLLRKMANADPTNTRSRIKVADLLRQEGKKEDAVSEYQLAAEELERQGDLETLGNVYRRILELDDKNVRALAALAQHLAARGKVAEAIPVAERALQFDDGTAERYEQLAELFERANRRPEQERVLRALAELYRKRGDAERAGKVLLRFAPLSDFSHGDVGRSQELKDDALIGGDADALFGDEFPDSEGAPELSVDFGSDIDIDPGSSRSGGKMQPRSDSLDPAASAPAPKAAAAPALDAEQLLAEASVYLRYGKRDKAIAHLQRVIEAEPEHRGALEKLGEAFAENGEHERAVEMWMLAAELAHGEGDADALRVLRGRIAVLDESAAAGIASVLREESPAAGDDDGHDLEVDAGPEPDEADDLVLDGDDDDSEEFLELSMTGAKGWTEPAPAESAPEIDDEPFEVEDPLVAPAPKAAPAGKVAAKPAAKPASMSASVGNLSASARQQVLDDLEEADFYMQQGLHDEAEAIYRRVLSVAPNHPRALLRLGEIEAARSDAALREGDSSPTLTDEVEISVDFMDEGIDDPEPLAAKSGLEDLSDLDLDAADAESGGDGFASGDGSDTQELGPGAESGAPAGDSDEGFDLAAALSDAFDDDPAASSGSATPTGDDGFAAVFQAFKKGVRETLSEGDHQAHYDLAIAYKEMGLFDDAIHELRTAMADPERTAECLHLIGLCAIDANQPPLAIEHLEELLATPGLANDAALAGRFDLGRALEAAGDLAGARRAWEAVAARKPDFQDVRARLAKLGAPKLEAPEGGDFESFEDVIAGVADHEVEPVEVTAGGETFDDLVEEANSPEPAASADAPKVGAEPLVGAEVIVEAEPVADETAPQPPRGPKPAPPPPRRKKKISFL